MVIVGDRGITQSRIDEELRGIEGLQWIGALRSRFDVTYVVRTRVIKDQSAMSASEAVERHKDLGAVGLSGIVRDRLGPYFSIRTRRSFALKID